jgi:hypothetical protein
VSAGLDQGSPGGFVNRNVKTGLILACVAFAFFVAIIAKYWLLK